MGKGGLSSRRMASARGGVARCGPGGQRPGGAADGEGVHGAVSLADTQWVVWTEGLTKDFGRVRAVDGADLRVPRGHVYGFVGPNGSGKTTAISIILGLMRPTRGTVAVLGHPLGTPGYRRALGRVGSLVQAPAFYPQLSGRDNLRILGSVLRPFDDREIDRALDRVGLLARARDRYATYSLGMRQRLAIALALLGDPELIILDEPTNGLDPVGIREVRALIRELGQEGRSVFLSSHLLHEVEQVCDEVGIIVRGRLVAQGPVRRLLGGRGLRVRVAAAGEATGARTGPERAGHSERVEHGANGALWSRAAEIIASLPGRPRVEFRGDGLWVDAPAERGAEVTRALAAAGLWVSEMVPLRSTLEQYFFEVAAAGAEVDPQPLAADGRLPADGWRGAVPHGREMPAE